MSTTDNMLDKFNLLLWSIFPSVETFQNFKSDKKNISFIEKIIALAQQKKSIQKESEAEFIGLINRCGEMYKGRKPVAELNFEMLISEIKKDISIKKLVLELKNIAGVFGLEKPNEVTITRLKQDFHPKTIKKQHTLMALTIWLAVNKPDLGLNFSAIINFPRRHCDTQPEPKEGILMELSFLEPRGNINPEVMTFLKDALPSCAKDLEMNYLNGAHITYLATACLLRIPIKKGFNGFPQNYSEAISNALSLSYQLLTSWQLTQFYSSKIQFSIAIDAGQFETTAESIKDLFHPSLPDNLPIRLSHIACMMAKQANIRVILNETSSLNVWTIVHFWDFPYFKPIPGLMPCMLADGKESSPLPVRDKDVNAFQNALFFNKTGIIPLLDTVINYPPKTMLALDVAHIATLRRMDHEAVQILSNVISQVQPYNPVARTMRMYNFIALGNYAREWITARLLFDRALYDGLFIEKHCQPSPVFYAVYGHLFYSQALKLINFLRNRKITEKIEDFKKEVLQCLEKAEYCYRMGMSVTHHPVDASVAFWFSHCFLFHKLLEKHPQLITDENLPFTDPDCVYLEEIQFLLKSFGIPDPNAELKGNKQFNGSQLIARTNDHLSSISAPSCQTGFLFVMPMTIWDISIPEYKAQIIDLIITFMQTTIEKTTTLKKMCLGVFTHTGVRSPGEFIKNVQKVKQFLEDIKRREDYANPVKISLMHLDDDIGYEPITYDLIQREEDKENLN